MKILEVWAIASTSATGCFFLSMLPAQAQGIVPADSTNTQVTPNGTDHAITGGTTSADSQNLFHQFSEFNVLTGESATFVTDPAILNILSGVIGSNSSLIDGLLQVSGSNANLFLINPNGILLGPNSALNLQGSFTATTADQVNFAEGAFGLIGSSDYAALVGEPQSFSFSLDNPASIVNAGDLAVTAGESVMLIGGQVLNTGTIAAPGGEIIISAIAGGNLVRIAQDGSLLNLEVETLAEQGTDLTAFSPLSLPELLTGSAAAIAPVDTVTVNPDGTVQLASGTPVNSESGAITAAGLLSVAATQGGQVLFFGEDIALSEGLIDIGGTAIGGELSVYATNQLTLGVEVNASGGGHALFDPPTFTVNEAEAATIVSTLNSTGSTTVEASEIININAAIDNSDNPEAPFGGLSLVDEDANGNLIINLNAPIRLSPGQFGSSQFLTGEGSTINVATTGLIQNGLAVALNEATVNLAAGTFQAGETLVLNRSLTLNGAGAGVTILNGEGEYPVVDVLASSDPAAPPVTISNLTITGGTDFVSGGSPAGGINNQGDLVITNSIIRNNQGLEGGGISNIRSAFATNFNDGRLTINNSAITNNSAFTGGGIANRDGSVTINNSTISGNTAESEGGAIRNVGVNAVNFGTSLTINNSTISNNSTTSASSDGGGILNNNGSLNIVRSTLNNNVSGEDGGAISDIGGRVSIDTSTIANNLARSGGGIATNNSDRLQIQSSTIVGNSASGGNGGGLVSDSDNFTLLLNLISGNNASNPASANIFNLGGIPVEGTSGANLFGASGNAGIAGFSPNSIGTVPSVGLSAIVSTTLADNGGPTQTLALVPGSPAIDKTSFGFINTSEGLVPIISLDQRGVPQFNELRDIGAFEFTVGGSGGNSDGSSSGGSSDADFECIAGDCNPQTSAQPNNLATAADGGTEVGYVEQFEDYLGVEAAAFDDFDALDRARNSTGVTPALIYAQFVPPSSDVAVAHSQTAAIADASAATKALIAGDALGQQIVAQAEGQQPAATTTNEDVLQLVLITADNEPRRINTGATRSEVIAAVRQLQVELTDRTRRRLDDYLFPAQALYGWLVSPLEEALAAENIGHVSFVLDEGLRSLPLAAMHDGDQFIIEQYSVGLMPSLSLTDTRIGNIRNAEVLAMGASEFSDQPPLPAVPLEIASISRSWSGEAFLNEVFTPEILVEQRSEDAYPILHLATHGQFTSGGLSNSYIQFWDRRLGLDDLPQLQLSDPTVELLVLSACRTVLGSEEAELGFAGLAIKSGAKSAIAALWQVSDLETAGLMAELYTHLGQVTYKAEALRQAQLAMLRGEVTVQNDSLIWSGGSEPLPDEFSGLSFADTRHPYYWSAFTLVGNPW